MTTVKTPKTPIPFEEMLQLMASSNPVTGSPISESDWIASIEAERARRIAEAQYFEYVAVPRIQPTGFPFMQAMGWEILGPKLDKPKLDACGNKVDRESVVLGVAGEGFGRDGISEFVQPWADDLAGALTAGRTYRLRNEEAKKRAAANPSSGDTLP